MRQLLIRAVLGLVVAGAGFYAGDWAVWRVRVARGGGMGSVTVSEMQVASLKGNKEEYYPVGTADVPCSVSVFGHVEGGACWWLRRHAEVVLR